MHTETLPDVSAGGVLSIITPTVTFADITFGGTAPNYTFTGTVTISATAASIGVTGGATPVSADAGAITGTYMLNGQSALRGTLKLSLVGFDLTLGGFVVVHADAASFTSRYLGTTYETTFGANGISARLGTETGARVEVTAATLGLLSRKEDAVADPKFALLVTGSAAINGVTGVTLAAPNWLATHNELGSLAAAPVIIDTGGGNVVLDFAANGTQLSGSATLGLGTIGSLEGTFAVDHNTIDDTLEIEATGVSAEIAAGTAVASLTGGSGSFVIGATDSSGTATGNVSLSGVPGLSFAAALDLAFDTATHSFALSGAGTLGIAGFLDLDGSFTFKATGTGADRVIEVGVTGTSVEAAAVLYADGTFAAAGIASVELPHIIQGLELSGDVTLEINTSGKVVSDTIGTVVLDFDATKVIHAEGTVTLVTPVGDITGDFELTKNLATNEVLISGTGVDLFVGDRQDTGDADDIGLAISNGSAHARIEPNGKHAFRASGDAALVNVSDVVLTGTFAAESNTTGEDVDLGGDTVLSGVKRVSGNGVKLAVGGIDLTGNFAVERSTSPGADGILGTSDDAGELLVGASGLSLSVGTGVQVSVTNASFVLLVAADTSYALEANGTAAVTGMNGLTLTGTVGFERNTSTSAVARQLVVGGSPLTLDVQAAPSAGTPFSRIGGTNVVLDLLGQHLSGDFTFVDVADGVSVTITDATVTLAGGVVQATDADATFTIGAAGIDATITADLTLVLPGLSFTGPVSVTVHYTDDSNPANDFVRIAVGVAGIPVTLAIAGQSVAGVFVFEATGAKVKVAATEVGLSFAGVLAITNASGQLVLTNAGVAAAVDAPGVHLAINGLITATVDLEIQVNTTPVAVSETFDVPGTDVTLDLPAGPFLRVLLVATAASPVDIAGNKLTGTFFFEQQTRPGPDGIAGGTNAADDELVTIVAMTGVAVTLSGGSNPTLTEGEGAFVILPAGVAGYISGKAALAAGGVQVGGRLLIRVNTTGGAVNETIVFGGSEIEIRFGEAEVGPGGNDFFQVSVSDLSLNIADVVSDRGQCQLHLRNGHRHDNQHAGRRADLRRQRTEDLPRRRTGHDGERRPEPAGPRPPDRQRHDRGRHDRRRGERTVRARRPWHRQGRRLQRRRARGAGAGAHQQHHSHPERGAHDPRDEPGGLPRVRSRPDRGRGRSLRDGVRARPQAPAPRAGALGRSRLPEGRRRPARDRDQRRPFLHRHSDQRHPARAAIPFPDEWIRRDLLQQHGRRRRRRRRRCLARPPGRLARRHVRRAVQHDDAAGAAHSRPRRNRKRPGRALSPHQRRRCQPSRSSGKSSRATSPSSRPPRTARRSPRSASPT